MKSRQLWIIASTALLSFVLGIVVAPAWRKSPEQRLVTNEAASSNRTSRSNQLDDPNSVDTTHKTRVRNRDESTDSKKSSEQMISIPLNSVAEAIKDKLEGNSGFEELVAYGIKDPLSRLGVSSEERERILTLFKETQSKIHAEEKKQIKLIRFDSTTIELSKSLMRPFVSNFIEQTQIGIRSILNTDLANALISSVEWDGFYRIDGEGKTTFTITRNSSGMLYAQIDESYKRTASSLGSNIADYGTPIPADQAFGDRWKPLLKGLTLLPQDEK
jgi:hypothetical protein